MIKLTEIYRLDEKLENVSNKRFFWVPKLGGKDFKPGDIVPKFTGIMESFDVEEVFEEIREDEFPDRPSRLNNNFVYPTIEGALADFEDRFYEVEATGKVFYTDLTLWSEGEDIYYGHDEEATSNVIREYWKGSLHIDKNTEAIIDGVVKIVKRINR